jgi:hypothetical protein
VFSREDVVGWCEANDVDFVFRLAQNERPIAYRRDQERALGAPSSFVQSGSGFVEPSSNPAGLNSCCSSSASGDLWEGFAK